MTSRRGLARGYRQTDLQPAFNAPGTHDFTVWGYGTSDPLAEVLRPDYRAAGRSILTPGNLIHVSARPSRDPGHGHETAETRLAIVMVCGFERGFARLCVVQHFGRPDDGGAAPPAPAEAASAGATPVAAARKAARPAPTPRRRSAAPSPGRRGKLR